jgi:hypothetical protein
MKKEQELKEVIEKIVPILKRHNVKRAGIFGSYARCEQTKKSDVDVLVDISDSVGLLGLISLKHDIEDAINKKADIVEYNYIKTAIKQGILTDEVRIL